jgi:hypothetical protein
MRYLITALLGVVMLAGCLNPKFLRDAHNYDPSDDPPQVVHYWGCEYPTSRINFWGDGPWSQGIYLTIEGKLRLVGFYSQIEPLSWGYGQNAIFEDRKKYGPLTRDDLGGQPWMQCRVSSVLMGTGTESPIGEHTVWGRVKGAAYINPGLTRIVIDPDDYTTEVRGHEGLHEHWQGEWEQKTWDFRHPMNDVGLQPSPIPPPTIVQRRIPPDDPPDYNERRNLRGQPVGVSYEELFEGRSSVF